MTLKKKKKIKILYDYREKQPWDTNYMGSDFECEKTKLETGDYQIKGMEKIVVIEKKNSWAELMLNVTKKTYRINFIKELRRMQKWPIKLLIIHADISKIKTTRTYGQVSSEILYGWIPNIILQYDVNFLAVGPRQRARSIIQEIFRRLYEYNLNGQLCYGWKGDK